MSDPQPAHPTRRTGSDRALAERMLAALRAGDDVRARKVRRVRAAVRSRAYENALKLHVALDRLAADLPPSFQPPGPPRRPGNAFST